MYDSNIMRFSSIEVLMILTCSVVIAMTSDIPIFAMVEAVVWLIPIILMKPNTTRELMVFDKDRRVLYAFIAAFSVYMGIQLYMAIQYPHQSYTKLGVIHLMLTLPILLAYIFRFKLSDFEWGISIKELLFVILMFILLREIPVFVALGKGSEIIAILSSFGFVKSFMIHLLYPSIVEEVLFRGFLLTGLISIGFKDDLSNVIQAVVFGLIHIIGKGELSIAVVMSCAVQVYLGFIFGKLYLNTKSLTPALLLHTLFNAYKLQ